MLANFAINDHAFNQLIDPANSKICSPLKFITRILIALIAQRCIIFVNEDVIRDTLKREDIGEYEKELLRGYLGNGIIATNTKGNDVFDHIHESINNTIFCLTDIVESREWVLNVYGPRIIDKAASELLDRGCYTIQWNDKCSDKDVADLCGAISGLMKENRSLNIVERQLDWTSNSCNVIKGVATGNYKEISIYCVERLSIIPSIRPKFPGKSVKICCVNQNNKIHERKVWVNSLLIHLDHSNHSISSSDPNWKLTIHWDEPGLKSTRDKFFGKFSVK